MKLFLRFASCCTLIFLFGCATPTTKGVSVSDAAVEKEADEQRDSAVQCIVEELKRLKRVGWTLATKAHKFCGGDLAPFTGAVFRSKANNELSPAYEKLYGVTERPTVLFVLDKSPASAAGLHARDVVTHINGTAVPSMAGLGAVLRTLGSDNPMRVRILRNGAALTIAIKPEKACRYHFVLQPDQAPNAYADGDRIVVTRGMMALAKDDSELSFVLAHELAHHAMHHMDAKKQNMLGELFAQMFAAISPRELKLPGNMSLMGALSYSQEFEAEADYVGLYILAASGLPFDDTPSFLRRMATANPVNISTNYVQSHPSFPRRLVALKATAKEIREKLERGLPIEPNMKDGQAAFSQR